MFDAIVVNQNNTVTVVAGTPASSPELPQIDSCQILLTYVLVNAGQTVPANVTQTIIYDENLAGEWPLDSLHNITGDTANTQFPAHGIKDFAIDTFLLSPPQPNNNFAPFASPNGNINLNSYGLLKFYIRTTTSETYKMSINWWLDGVQQTFSPPIFVNTNSLAYTIVVLPISFWQFITTPTVNKLHFTFLNSTGQHAYIDWIQLQQGTSVGITTSTGVQSLLVDTLTGFAAFPVANPTTNAHVLSNFLNAPPFTVWANDRNVSAAGHYTTLDLSNNSYFNNTQLSLTNISTICDGCYLGGQGGTNTAIPFEIDTTYKGNWLVYRKNPNDTHIDTLYDGYSKRDTAHLLFNTFFALNGFTATYTQGATNVLIINSSGIAIGDGVMPTSGSGGTDSAVFKNSSTGQFYLAPGGGITADNGLTANTSTNVQLGGSLLNNTVINAGTLYNLTVSGNSGGNAPLIGTQAGVAFAIEGTNTSNGGGGGIWGHGLDGSIGVKGESTTGYGVYGAASNGGIGVFGTSDVGLGIWGLVTSTLGTAGAFYSNTNNTNSVLPVVSLIRELSSGTAANGVGGSLDYITQVSSGGQFLSNRISSLWTDATSATRTSQLIISGVNSASTNDILILKGDGTVNIPTNVQNFLNNAAAIVGGLVVGDIYRNGDIMQIVH
jgi:hypothetical protein